MEILTSKIMLCKGIKLDKDYINVLNYSESDMVSLCQSKAIAIANDYSFIRNTGRISTNFEYSDALKCDYIAFQNMDYSNKEQKRYLLAYCKTEDYREARKVKVDESLRC
jgi:hypothetical protein